MRPRIAQPASVRRPAAQVPALLPGLRGGGEAADVLGDALQYYMRDYSHRLCFVESSGTFPWDLMALLMLTTSPALISDHSVGS
jgi:hypothetical protein